MCALLHVRHTSCSLCESLVVVYQETLADPVHIRSRNGSRHLGRLAKRPRTLRFASPVLLWVLRLLTWRDGSLQPRYQTLRPVGARSSPFRACGRAVPNFSALPY